MKSSILKTLLCVSVIAAGVSCSGNKTKQAEDTVVLHKVSVETATKRDVIQQTTFTGTVEAQVVNNISPQSSRRISRILFDVGDHVKAGELLVELDR